jgi:CBS domain-containing protein
MQPPLTTVERYDHVAAAAYLMRHAGATSLMVLDASTDRLIGIVTGEDVAHAVADGKDVDEIRIHDVMTTRQRSLPRPPSIRDAAKIMTSSHFRHLPIVGDTGLQGVLDINDVCRHCPPMAKATPANHDRGNAGPAGAGSAAGC